MGLYCLLFIENDKERLYGTGDMKYMIELLDDYCVTHKMYGKKELKFKIIDINELSKQIKR